MIPALLLTIQLALATVLAGSAVVKLRSPGRFARDLGRYRLLPAALVRPAAGLVIAAEVVAAGMLVAGYAPGAWLALALALVFAGAVGSALARNLVIPCGCFGGDETVSDRALIRVGLLGAAAIAAIVLGLFGVTDPIRGMDLLWVATAAAGLLIAGRLILLVPDVRAAMGRGAVPEGGR